MDPASTPTTPSDLLQQLIDSIEIDGIYMLDAAGCVIIWNRGAELNKGYTREEILGRHYRLFFTPEDVAAHLPESILAEVARSGRKSGEGWRLRKNGQRFWASFVLTAMRDEQGVLIGYSKVIRDLSAHKLQEDAMLRLQVELQAERDRLQAAAESSLDALFLCEAIRGSDGHIEDFLFTFLNSNAQRYTPTPNASLLGRRMRSILPVSPALAFFDRYREIVATGQPFIHEYASDDHPFLHDTWLRMQAVKLHDGLAITISDITERKHNQLQVEYLAQHDPLTGLLNRNILDYRIQQAISRATSTHRIVAFLILDLDQFKTVNDRFGHAAGDRVLRAVAQRFNASVRATDTLVRIGGDEFILILPDILHLRDLIPIVNKLVDSLQPLIYLGDQDGNAIQQSCSIGIAVYPDSAIEPAELLRRADSAMYAAKVAGNNLNRLFTPHPTNSDQGLFFSLDELPTPEKASGE